MLNTAQYKISLINSPGMTTIVIGMRQMVGNAGSQTEWPIVMITALLAILPPVMVVLLMQRWFVRGLVEPEK
jgi:sn-glycerol 3-phosphate transport system permease protein